MLTNRFFPFSLIIFLFTHFQSLAQCSFTASDNSYRVDVKVHVISLSVSATGGDCTFNYAVVQYDIDFVSLNGTPPPSSMYTLQGTVTCNGKSMFFDLPNEGGPYVPGQPNAWATTNSATAGGNPFNPSAGNCSGYNASYCNQIRITIHGLNISSQTVLCTATPTPLSTRLQSFDVSSSNDRTVEIDWSTTDEKNSSHYVLEHSQDNGAFETIAEINSKGETNKVTNYSFSHENRLPGIHIYRLSEIDINGNRQELETKGIQLISQNDFAIFPNPTNSGSPTYVVFSPRKNMTSYIEVVSAIGTVIEKRILDNTAYSHELQLTKGQYFVRIIENDIIIGTKSVVIL